MKGNRITGKGKANSFNLSYDEESKKILFPLLHKLAIIEQRPITFFVRKAIKQYLVNRGLLKPEKRIKIKDLKVEETEQIEKQPE